MDEHIKGSVLRYRARACGADHLSADQRRNMEDNFREALIRAFPDDAAMERARRDWAKSSAPGSTVWGVALTLARGKSQRGVPKADDITFELEATPDIR
jgi:hypothetical protein